MSLFADIMWVIGLAIGIPIMGATAYCLTWSATTRAYGPQAPRVRELFSVSVAVIVAAAFLVEGLAVLHAS